MRVQIRTFTTFWAVLFIAGRLLAQGSASLQFQHLTHDFGSISEADGIVTHSFVFRNTGHQPVAILAAATTCGCTVTSFSRKPVMPSETSAVEVSFDPAERPGHFDKKITVTTSEGGEPYRLFITGSVVPRQRTIEELYPVYIGHGLRAETIFHAFGYVEHGKCTRTAFGIVNTSQQPLRIRVFNTSEQGLYLPATADGASFMTLAAGAAGEITVTAAPAEECGRYGTITEHLAFEVEGRREEIMVAVTGIVIDNRDKAPDNLAPKSELNKNIIKFGVVKHDGGECCEYFELASTGEAPLAIRAVEGVAAGTVVSLQAGESLAAGERRRVEVRIRPSEKGYGPAVEHIRIITDDPLHPMRELRVTMITEQ